MDRDTYIKSCRRFWYNFKNSLRNETDWPHSLTQYFSETETLLNNRLEKVSQSHRNFKHTWLENLDKLHKLGLICVPTDKNLGIALSERVRFLQLEKAWINASDWYVINKIQDVILAKLQRSITKVITTSELSQKIQCGLLYKLGKHNSLPKFKGILKIHKPTLQVRPVIRENAGPVFVLSKALCPYLKEILELLRLKYNVEHILNNSLELVVTLDSLAIPISYTPWVLFSADVKSKYPTFSKFALLAEIRKDLRLLNYAPRKAKFIMDSLRLIFYNNYFTHEEVVFKAGAGIASYRTSVHLANISKLMAENRLIKSNPDVLLLYRRYVDDIVAILDVCYLDSFKQKLSLVWEGFELTSECSRTTIDFLDLTIYRLPPSNRFLTKIFQKPQNLYQYLHWDSSHPREIFRGIYLGEICRYIRNSGTYKNFMEIKRLFQRRLKKRNWPHRFIFECDWQSPPYRNRPEILKGAKRKIYSAAPFTLDMPFVTHEVSNTELKIIIQRNWNLLPQDLVNRKCEIRYKYDRNMSKRFTF